jgi:hypothetical protein
MSAIPDVIPLLSPILKRKLDALEVPDCGCPHVIVPACLRAGHPCKDFTRPGKKHHGPRAQCDCPLVPGTPCEHIFHADDQFYSLPWAAELIEDEGPGSRAEVLRRWAAKLLAAMPGDYREPPLPTDVILGPEVAVRVAKMSARWGDDPDRPLFRLHHPADARKGEDDRLETERERLINGSDRETGLRIFDANQKQAPPVLIWDEFDCWWILRVEEVARRVQKGRDAA